MNLSHQCGLCINIFFMLGSNKDEKVLCAHVCNVNADKILMYKIIAVDVDRSTAS